MCLVGIGERRELLRNSASLVWWAVGGRCAKLETESKGAFFSGDPKSPLRHREKNWSGNYSILLRTSIPCVYEATQLLIELLHSFIYKNMIEIKLIHFHKSFLGCTAALALGQYSACLVQRSGGIDVPAA
jgi:hypothetical protein